MTSTWLATTARNAGCSARAQQFKSTYNALCRDPNCKVGIFILVADFSAQCLKNNGESVSFPAELWAVKGEAPHIAKMDKLLAESVARAAAAKPKMPVGALRSLTTSTPSVDGVKESAPTEPVTEQRAVQPGNLQLKIRPRLVP